MILSETKAKQNKLQKLKQQLSFDNIFVVDSVGTSGGLCLLWKNSVSAEVIYSDCNVIHSYVINKNTNVGFHYSFVYGIPIRQHRKHFWEKLRRLHIDTHKPWICSGDFNEMLHQSDKSGDQMNNKKQMQPFKDFITDKHMEELPQRGNRFTWCNNRITGTVQDKLDRSVVNWEWQKVFPNALVTTLTPISSDHNPLIIVETPSCGYSRKTFKLEPYWTEHEDFKPTVEHNWNCDDSDIMTRLSKVQAGLQEWSKKTFKMADYKIKRLKNKLEKLHNLPATKEIMEKRFKIKKEVKDLWKQEEMY